MERVNLRACIELHSGKGEGLGERIYRNWHPDDAETYLLEFPWPQPGEVPAIPGRYFVPTEKEKTKIQWLIDNFNGEEEEPWVKELVKLARAVLEEVQ